MSNPVLSLGVFDQRNAKNLLSEIIDFSVFQFRPLTYLEMTVVHQRVSKKASERLQIVSEITAVVNSIDRSTEDRAPNRCLPFDGIGARHPG